MRRRAGSRREPGPVVVAVARSPVVGEEPRRRQGETSVPTAEVSDSCRAAAAVAVVNWASDHLLVEVGAGSWPCLIVADHRLTTEPSRWAYRNGRSRRIGKGSDHQRPLKRHERLRGAAEPGAAAGRGQSASTAAMIATTSSSVGAGDAPSTMAGAASSTASDIGDTIGRSATGDLVLDRPARSGGTGDDGAGEVVVERSAIRIEEGDDESDEEDR